MNDTYTLATDIPRIVPGREATILADAMYVRLIDELSALSTEEWSAPTECDPWTVADMVRHIVGAAKGHASLREMARQSRIGKRNKDRFDGNDMDAMNALQVDDHADLGPVALLEELKAVAPEAVAKRMSRPKLMHKIRIPMAAGGSTAEGMPSSLTLGHLLTVILTRDIFMHRIDIASATGRQVFIDADHEGRLIADVVAEWSDRHGAPFRLTLMGPAGGAYQQGTNGTAIELDAIEFCRILSGRATAVDPLLATRVLF